MNKTTLYKFLAAFLVVVALYGLIDRGGTFVLNGLVMRSKIRFSRLYSGNVDASLLLLGNSRSVHSLHAPSIKEATGVSVFHLGYNGMSMELCEAVFGDYLEWNSAPDTLVLELSNLNDTDELVKDFKMYTPISARLSGVLLQEDSFLFNACSFIHLFRFNSELFLRAIYYLGHDDQFWINKKVIMANHKSTLREGDVVLSSFAGFTEDNLIALYKILDRCDDLGIKVRLFIAPYCPGYFHKQSDFGANLKVFLASLSRYKDVQFYDYSDMLGRQSEFSDPIHMNYEGSQDLLSIMLQDNFFGI